MQFNAIDAADINKVIIRKVTQIPRTDTSKKKVLKSCARTLLEKKKRSNPAHEHFLKKRSIQILRTDTS